MLWVNLLLFVLFCVVGQCYSLLQQSGIVRRRLSSHGLSVVFSTSGDSGGSSFDGKTSNGLDTWMNEKYPANQLEKWWGSIDPLLTVGMKGVQPSHVNSLAELLKQHDRVRVKLASDKLNAIEISKSFVDSESLSGTAELLFVRRKGFMVGRK